ncbi:MAG: hypothetical protein ACFCVE_00015 [Phycisphaerae bacterium]
MSNQTKNNRSWAIGMGIGAVVLAVGLGATMLLLGGRPAPDDDLERVVAFVGSEAFTKLPAAEQKPYADRLREVDRDTLRGLENVPEEVVREASRNTWEVARNERMEALNERMDIYFALPQAERNAHLDAAIDELVARQKEWQQQAAQRAAQRAAQGDNADRGGEGRGQGRGEGANDGDRQSRAARGQERHERADPGQSARRAEYFAALWKRAEERGIEFGRPGGGRRR